MKGALRGGTRLVSDAIEGLGQIAGRARRPVVGLVVAGCTLTFAADPDVETRVIDLLERMTLAEKIGQMSQINGAAGEIPDDLRDAVRSGAIGSILNEVDVDVVRELQRVAVEDSRLGIPLLFGRDVVHGFETVLPIPLGQAATFNPDLVRRGARMAAFEAAASGVNWTFAPVVDVTRDPRWGRIAETFGEDPYLTAVMGVAAVEGFQGPDPSRLAPLAACVKHFAGYGAVEAGRDYAAASIPERELRDVYLPPFRAAVDAGVATVMASFNDLNGVPATGNRFLMTELLRNEWRFGGFVVSDWASIEELTVHGIAESDREAAYQAVAAGVNMEMATPLYRRHLAALVAEGRVSVDQIDARVADILRVKLRLGLFEAPYVERASIPPVASDRNLAVARDLALESLVLLENRAKTLPLDVERIETLAVIGPLADDAHEQLGTWVFDGDVTNVRTPLRAIREQLAGRVAVRYEKAMTHSRDRSTVGFDRALAAAREAEAVVVFLGEEAILSGEAHSRADIGLPGRQAELVRTLRKAGKPLVAVVLAGRPLTLDNILDDVDAVLYAWHPGTMGGPAIADVLFGVESPSGKLPVTFPKTVGQIPIYYAHKRTGRPASAATFTHIDDIPVRQPQTSTGFVSNHLDAGFEPRYRFGHGLTYGRFEYGEIESSDSEVIPGESVVISAVVRNEGAMEAVEVVQLYVADEVAQVTRPVRELKSFRRVRLAPGESRRVSFELTSSELAFHGRDLRPIVEPGAFRAWIGGSSAAELEIEFRIVEPSSASPRASE